jgi:hypothetical protein
VAWQCADASAYREGVVDKEAARVVSAARWSTWPSLALESQADTSANECRLPRARATFGCGKAES